MKQSKAIDGPKRKRSKPLEEGASDLQKKIQKIRDAPKRKRARKNKNKVDEEAEDAEFELDLLEAVDDAEDEYYGEDAAKKTKLRKKGESLRKRLGDCAKDAENLLERMKGETNFISGQITAAAKSAHLMGHIRTLLNPPMGKLKAHFLRELKTPKDAEKTLDGPKQLSDEDKAKIYDSLTLEQKQMLVTFFYAYVDDMYPVIKPLQQQMQLVLNNFAAEKVAVGKLRDQYQKLAENNASFVGETLESMGSGRLMSMGSGGSMRLNGEGSDGVYNPGGFVPAGVF